MHLTRPQFMLPTYKNGSQTLDGGIELYPKNAYADREIFRINFIDASTT